MTAQRWVGVGAGAGSRPAAPAYSGGLQRGIAGQHSPSQPHRAVQRFSAAWCPQTGRDFPNGLARASRKPADGLSGLWTNIPHWSCPRRPLAAFLAASWPMLGGGVRGKGRLPPPARFPISPLFDPGRRLGVDRLGRSSSRRLLAAAARSGGQGWCRLAPGPERRAGPASGRAWRARQGPTPCPQRAPWHLRELSTGRSYPQRKVQFLLKFRFRASQHTDINIKKWGRYE